jgi:hypothetical protein
LIESRIGKGFVMKRKSTGPGFAWRERKSRNNLSQDIR